MTDLRSVPRYPLRLPALVTGLEAAVVVEAMTRDLSVRGVFLYSPAEVVAGSKIEFTFRMPKAVTSRADVRVHCKATVVRVEAAAAEGIGVAAKITGYKFLGSSAPES